MAYQSISNQQKIMKIIDYLISKKIDIKVLVEDICTPYSSKVISIDQGQPLNENGENSIIIQKVTPESGNDLIQRSKKIILKFLISDQVCICSVRYMGISAEPPNFGFILTVPEMIDAEERRIQKRVTYNLPDFLSAVICFDKGTQKEKIYELDVFDRGSYGLGMIIQSKDADILKRVKVGDTIRDVQFYAAGAMITIDGIVRHITKIEEGKFLGSYSIGIESKDLISNARITI
jgi:hypothetical protein